MKSNVTTALGLLVVLASAAAAQPHRHAKAHAKKIARLSRGESRAAAQTCREDAPSKWHFRWMRTRGPKAKLTPGAPVGGADRFRF